MDGLKKLLVKIKDTIQKSPKWVIPIALFLFLFLIVLVESTRAFMYLQTVKNYKNSARVQSLHEAVDKLQRSEELQPSAYFCTLSLENQLEKFNDAYDDNSGNNESDQLVNHLHDKAAKASPAPAFSSLLRFGPFIHESNQQSVDMSQGLETVLVLTEKDIRSTYCLELQEVFSRMYFLKSLAQPEGVAALLPGQVENFQVNVRQAQENLAEIKTIPKTLAKDHGRISLVLQEISKDLRRNTNKYDAFSRSIQDDIENMESIATAISDKTEDLHRRPQSIALQASYLR